ncbi:MAG: FAD-binding protein [Dehalococcoidia bacterium]
MTDASVPGGPAADRHALTGWGRATRSLAHVVRPRDAHEVTALLTDGAPSGLVPRGMGRAYGDAAQNAGGVVLDGTGLDAPARLDAERGVLTVSGGTSMESILRQCVGLGWFPPVTPGTRHVTVGGAIAADVHGKNHHADGSFARYVESITLALPGRASAPGEVRTVTPESDAPLFWATAGGMGLTGVILEARIRMRRIESPLMLVETRRARDLEAVMELLAEGDARAPYSVAWLDLLARGTSLGRGVVSMGDHAPVAALPAARGAARGYAPRRGLPAPPPLPGWLLSRPPVRALNAAWFRRAPARRVDELQSIDAFFYPLDLVDGWNRAYGASGMLQWQCLVPFEAERLLAQMVGELARGPVPVTLAVLKRMGEGSPGHLSFPAPGWTLAADLPAVRRPALDALLDRLDALVADAGGRIYLAKDARMRPEWLPRMYPRIEEWREVQARVDPDGRLTSDLDRRLGLTARAAARLPRPARDAAD